MPHFLFLSLKKQGISHNKQVICHKISLLYSFVCTHIFFFSFPRSAWECISCLEYLLCLLQAATGIGNKDFACFCVICHKNSRFHTPVFVRISFFNRSVWVPTETVGTRECWVGFRSSTQPTFCLYHSHALRGNAYRAWNISYAFFRLLRELVIKTSPASV